MRGCERGRPRSERGWEEEGMVIKRIMYTYRMGYRMSEMDGYRQDRTANGARGIESSREEGLLKRNQRTSTR